MRNSPIATASTAPERRRKFIERDPFALGTSVMLVAPLIGD